MCREFALAWLVSLAALAFVAQVIALINTIMATR